MGFIVPLLIIFVKALNTKLPFRQITVLKNRQHLTRLLSCIVLFFPILSQAELHATLTMTTNNSQRWFSKSNSNPALQANIEYQHHSGLFLGSSVSNVEFESLGYNHPSSAHVEIVPYLGWNFKLAEQWRMDVEWSRYLYNGSVFGHRADYNEYYLFLHYKDLFSARISYTDDYYNVGYHAFDYEGTAKYPITDKLEASSSFGYSQTQAALSSDYLYWNAGLTYYYKLISLDLRYMQASEINVEPALEEQKHESYNPPLLDATVVFSISLGF